MQQPQDEQQLAPLSRKEQRAAARFAKQIARAEKKQARRDQAAASTAYDVTRTNPDSFYEKAIEWTHRADKIINLVLGYLLAIASVLGFMDVLSNGEVLGHVPFLFYVWLLIMGLGVDFQILLVIGRVPDLARMVGHPVGKWVLVIFNIIFLSFLAYVSIIIGAVFTQHRDVPGTIVQAMQVLNINSTSFVYERAALATFLLILMAIDRTMERWRMQIAAGNRQQGKHQQVQVTENEETGNTPQGIQTSNLAQIIQAMQEMNDQNLAAMQAMNNETMNCFSTVTVELVRETIERTVATVALPEPGHMALPAGNKESQETAQEAADAPEKPERGKQTIDYGALIEQMYLEDPNVTTTIIEQRLGCTRKTASKHLQRLRPVPNTIVVTESIQEEG